MKLKDFLKTLKDGEFNKNKEIEIWIVHGWEYGCKLKDNISNLLKSNSNYLKHEVLKSGESMGRFYINIESEVK